VVASCSGARSAGDGRLDPARLAESLESSPCGGGDMHPMAVASVAEMAKGFESWPLPPVFISTEELDGDAVACFDGDAVLVHTEHADDRVIVAHEFCHAIAYLFDRTAPLGFPSPEPRSGRALALEPEIWHQEIWAVSCSSGVTGDEDWSWGHLVHDSSPEAHRWAADFVAAGPPEVVDVPANWAPVGTPP